MNTSRLDTDMSTASNEQWMQQLPAIRRALLNEHRHIVVSSGSTQVLEEAGMALVRDLLKIPGVKVLSQQPASTDVILQRFNKLLADIPVDNALDRDAGRPEAIHVFVVHDGPSLHNSDFALMARLVSDLPGAHMRLVVIVDASVSAQERVQAVGRKALHWAVGPSKRSTQHWLTGEAAPAPAASPRPLANTAHLAGATLSSPPLKPAPKSAPKALWLGLAMAALMAVGVSTWLWIIDQPPPSALITEPAPNTSNETPPASSAAGTGTARVTGSITEAPAPAPAPTTPQESRP
jgi:hypothetical protein